MPRKPQDVTDAELALLRILWCGGAATVRTLSESMYTRQTPSDLATVQKLLNRLEDKNCVCRAPQSRPALYEPTIDLDALIQRRLMNTADSLCAGAYAPLLQHLVRGQQLSSRDREELRRLLDEREGVSRQEPPSPFGADMPVCGSEGSASSLKTL